MPTPKKPIKTKLNNFFAIAPSRNLGCFSIDPIMTIAQTIRAKTGIVIINQSNSEVMLDILTMISLKSR